MILNFMVGGIRKKNVYKNSLGDDDGEKKVMMASHQNFI